MQLNTKRIQKKIKNTRNKNENKNKSFSPFYRQQQQQQQKQHRQQQQQRRCAFRYISDTKMPPGICRYKKQQQKQKLNKRPNIRRIRIQLNV